MEAKSRVPAAPSGGGQFQSPPKTMQMATAKRSQHHPDEEESKNVEYKLEDQLTNEKLRELEHIFEEADEDGGGGLDMDEFRNAMRQALGKNLSNEELDLLFMKVDTNCDGTVDWDEYLSYMLLEYTGKDQINSFVQEKMLPRNFRQPVTYQRHNDAVVKIIHLPNTVKLDTSLFREIGDRGGRYATISKEGVLNTWNMDMKHLRSQQLVETKGRASSVWVTGMCYLVNVNLMAVATTSSKILFYDISKCSEKVRVSITDLDVCALCMDSWCDNTDASKALLLWGDSRGSVYVLIFRGCPQLSVLHPHIIKNAKDKLSLSAIIRGEYAGLHAHVLMNIHDDAVKHVRYIHELNSIISCSRSRNNSMYRGDLDERRRGSFFKVKKGINAFDFCSKTSVVVTGGYDTMVRVWNPYIPSKPLMIFQGHKSPVTYILVNQSREHIISISEEKDIFIFDMNTQATVQAIYRQSVPLKLQPISAAFFNDRRQALLLATTHLAVFAHNEDQMKTKQLLSHTKPVTVVLYNRLFKCVVSGGMDSLVCVWCVNTGQRTMQFTAHRRVENGFEIKIEITAMSFDPTLRRLFTGARDGVVKIWNFNNGACLRVLERSHYSEITSILCFRNRIVLGGWGRTLTVFMDNPDDDSVRKWKKMHQEDILSMAFYRSHIVASSSYDGDIFVWSIETGCPLAKIQLRESIKIQTMYHSMHHSSVLGDDPKIAKPFGDAKQGVNDRDSVNEASVRGADRGEPHPDTMLPDLVRNLHLGERQKGLSCPYPKNLHSVDKLLFLNARTNDIETAVLLASGAEGWVRAWSIHHESGLIGQFNASHSKGHAVLAMATDDSNKFLITGDTNGYIKVWNIKNYCMSNRKRQAETQEEHEALVKKFPFLRMKTCMEKTKEYQLERALNCHAAKHLVKYPQLLSSHRGHTQSITDLDFLEDRGFIVSCSSDRSVRLWALTGQYIGLFGQGIAWDLSKMSLPGKRKFFFTPGKGTRVNLPPDVRRVGSATTLQVLNGGVCPRWSFAKNIILVWIPKLKRKDDSTEPSHEETVPTAQASTSGVTQESEGYSGTSEIGLSTENHSSDILGKSYKQTRRHQILPSLSKPRQFMNQVAVYSTLPCMDLAEVKEPEQPPLLQEVLNRNVAHSLGARGLGAAANRQYRRMRRHAVYGGPQNSRIRTRQSVLVSTGQQRNQQSNRNLISVSNAPSRGPSGLVVH